MTYETHFIHYLTIALAVAVNSVGVGIGEGLTSLAALKALSLQPSAQSEISRIFILGMALIETSAVIGLTMSLMLLTPLENMGTLLMLIMPNMELQQPFVYLDFPLVLLLHFLHKKHVLPLPVNLFRDSAFKCLCF